jgi:hypothetical protein
MLAYETADGEQPVRCRAVRGRRASVTTAAIILTACCFLTPAASQTSEQPPNSQSTAATPAANPPATAKPATVRQSARAAGYYVEFRTAQIGLYGHSYAAYGRLDGRGNPASAEYADLHPMGNYGVMALGHFVPVPANMAWDPEVLKLPIAHRYRRNLTADQYKNLTARVERLRAGEKRYWNAVTHNCNHFIGELAESVGLKVPMQFHLSYGFVEDLKTINETSSPAAAQPERRPQQRKTANAASTSAQPSTAASAAPKQQ